MLRETLVVSRVAAGVVRARRPVDDCITATGLSLDG